jgi:two-component system, NarL family, sensor histidine kinase DesK
MESTETRTQESHRSDQPAEVAQGSRLNESSSTGWLDIVAASGISLRLWRLYASFWLVCLIFPILYLLQMPQTPVRLIVAMAGLAIFACSYLWIMWPHPLSSTAPARNRLRIPRYLFLGLFALVTSFSLAYGSAFLWLFVGLSALAGVVMPARHAFWAVSILTLLTLAVSLGASEGITGVDWLHVIPLLLLVRGLGVDMTGLIRLSDALRELHAAREELAHQAVMEERLRLARDLHDLLGHTLSMITLKSELARRLIEKEPTKAAQEIHEIEGVARQALREVREAVAGYREQTLQGELDSARQILEAAGIVITVEHTARVLPAAINAALAWMVREGVTNVIRHSRARWCTIRITHRNGIMYAEVTNDGYAGQESPAPRIGSGINGLAERVAAQGGQLEAGPHVLESGMGFRLSVEIPIQRSTIQEEQ